MLDDECPHEGHPLSMGLHRDGTLVCQWHNWRFDARSGQCLVGEESVRRHPSEVLHGEVFIALDASDGERERHASDVALALDAASVDGVVRSALRLARVSAPHAAFSAVYAWIAGRGRTGPADALSRANASWCLYEAGALSLPESLAVLAASVLDALAGARAVREPAPVESGEEDVADVLLALADERVDDAVARALGVREGASIESVGRAWLAPWLATKLWDGGLLFARTQDALACVRRVEAVGDGPLARRLLAAIVRGAGFSVAESDLPGWRTTRQALLDARSLRAGQGSLADPARLAVDLANSEAQALAGARREIDAGASVSALSTAIARAAVERLAQYDPRWSRRKTVRPSRALDVGASARFARALCGAGEMGRGGVALALMGAGLLGKQRRTSRPTDGDIALAHHHHNDNSPEALRSLVREGCLFSGALRGEGVALAASLWALAATDIVDVSRCAQAARRAFIDDPRPDLARVAEVAALRVAQDGR